MAIETDLRRGAFYAVASGAAFAVMGAFIKLAARELPNEMVVFLRILVGLLILLPWMLRRGPGGLHTKRLSGHLLRALFGMTSMYCFFYGIAHLHLAEAMLLTYSMPLFIPFIAWAWLGERPSARVYPAVLIGFAGIALVLKPGSELFSMAGLIGLTSGVTAAAAMTNIRRISDTEPTSRIVFYFSLFGSFISAVPLLWAWRTPTLPTLAVMLAAGLCATGGQLLLTRAYALAPAARISSLVYSVVIFAALLGWALWGETPDGWSLLGMLLVVGAGVMTTAGKLKQVEVALDPVVPAPTEES